MLFFHRMAFHWCEWEHIRFPWCNPFPVEEWSAVVPWGTRDLTMLMIFFSFFCFAKRAKIIDPNSVWWQWMQLNLLHNKKQFDNQQLFKKGASSCLRGTPTWRLLSNRAAIYYHLSPRFMCQLLLWWIHESDIKTLNTFHSSKERNLKLTLVWFQTSGGI